MHAPRRIDRAVAEQDGHGGEAGLGETGHGQQGARIGRRGQSAHHSGSGRKCYDPAQAKADAARYLQSRTMAASVFAYCLRDSAFSGLRRPDACIAFDRRGPCLTVLAWTAHHFRRCAADLSFRPATGLNHPHDAATASACTTQESET
jgi:hypothetical protein